MTHRFTVDVEEYFQVSALEGAVPRTSWNDRESRVTGSVLRLLELLARHQARGTFFTLGWIAERHPLLVREIDAAGHEIASHGWDHRRVTTQTPSEFRASVGRTKALLEDVVGRPVAGFRAPSFSIVPGTEWALDVLIEAGHRYDSSLFPIRRRGYGYRAAGRDAHWIERPVGRLFEVPPSTLEWGGARIPAGGGAYFRLLPYDLVRAGLRNAAARGTPGTFYIHPWELDPAQPRLPVGLVTRMRHYGGLGRTADRLERLLAEFRFESIAASLETEAACSR
ncbi:MAG: XrtA system polysaccharide deacetylase [Longimicrobiales bacterium]